METRKEVLYCFYKIFLKDNSTNEGKFLNESDFLDTRSYFVPTSQNARLTTHNQSKFVWCHSRVPYSHLNTAIDQRECAYYLNYITSSILPSILQRLELFITQIHVHISEVDSLRQCCRLWRRLRRFDWILLGFMKTITLLPVTMGALLRFDGDWCISIKAECA